MLSSTGSTNVARRRLLNYECCDEHPAHDGPCGDQNTGCTPAVHNLMAICYTGWRPGEYVDTPCLFNSYDTVDRCDMGHGANRAPVCVGTVPLLVDCDSPDDAEGVSVLEA